MLCRRSRVGKRELRGLGLETQQEESGSLAVLTPIRTPGPMRNVLGNSEVRHAWLAHHSCKTQPLCHMLNLYQ